MEQFNMNFCVLYSTFVRVFFDWTISGCYEKKKFNRHGFVCSCFVRNIETQVEKKIPFLWESTKLKHKWSIIVHNLFIQWVKYTHTLTAHLNPQWHYFFFLYERKSVCVYCLSVVCSGFSVSNWDVISFEIHEWCNSFEAIFECSHTPGHPFW